MIPSLWRISIGTNEPYFKRRIRPAFRRSIAPRSLSMRLLLGAPIVLNRRHRPAQAAGENLIPPPPVTYFTRPRNRRTDGSTNTKPPRRTLPLGSVPATPSCSHSKSQDDFLTFEIRVAQASIHTARIEPLIQNAPNSHNVPFHPVVNRLMKSIRKATMIIHTLRIDACILLQLVNLVNNVIAKPLSESEFKLVVEVPPANNVHHCRWKNGHLKQFAVR